MNSCLSLSHVALVAPRHLLRAVACRRKTKGGPMPRRAISSLPRSWPPQRDRLCIAMCLPAPAPDRSQNQDGCEEEVLGLPLAEKDVADPRAQQPAAVPLPAVAAGDSSCVCVCVCAVGADCWGPAELQALPGAWLGKRPGLIAGWPAGALHADVW